MSRPASLRFWWLPRPPRSLPRPVRRAWLALSLWRGWPAPRFADDYDPFADIDARLAWTVAGGLEGGAS